MNISDIIVLLIVLAAAGLALRHIIRTRKTGSCSCGCGSSCSSCASPCNQKTLPSGQKGTD